MGIVKNSNKTTKAKQRKEKNSEQTSVMVTKLFICTTPITALFIQEICMKTLLYVDIPWIHYVECLLAIIVCGFVLIKAMRKVFKKRNKNIIKAIERFGIVFIFTIVIVPSLIFLPNRLIPIESEHIFYGHVVENNYWKPPSKSTGRITCVKIKIDCENTWFWYDSKKKAIGTRCLISERKGIWGLRYVTNVDFIVE